ncbi:MAG: hypothetical protein ACWGNO_00585 [Desulfobacterales bacterium]
MKINGSDEIIKSGYTDKPLQKEPAQNDDFKNILKASVERTAHHQAKTQSSTLMQPISAIKFSPLSPENKRITIDRLDNLLNMLDHYRKQLADPQVSLRRIEPLMNTIEKEKEQLSSVLDSLASEDGLKDIVNRTLITASLEVIKYNRGDYITS